MPGKAAISYSYSECWPRGKLRPAAVALEENCARRHVMSAALPHLATSEEIVQMHAKMEALKLLMAERRHGGAGKQGRYLKHDTARLSFIDGCGLRDLAGGKLPSAADQRALFDLPGDLEIAGTPEQKEMDEWRNRHHADPRSKAHKDAGLSIQRQTTLLAWARSNAASFARTSAPRGLPSAYRLDFGPYVGYTLMDLVHDGNRNKLTWTGPLVKGKQIPGGPHLHWMARSLDFSFPKHTRLYLGLRELDRDGVLVMGNGARASLIGERIDSSRAHTAYVAWMQPALDAARAATAADGSAATDSTPTEGSQPALPFLF